MRKIFSFFAAMLVAFVANAATINIDNTTPDALRLALANAADGDEIVMAAGTYVESNGNYIAFDGKNVTVKAAEGAEVIIQPQVPITVANGGCANFVNVKIDASRLTELADWYEHLAYAADATATNSMNFDGCELYGFALNKSMLYCNSSNVLGGVRINNCYIHNNMKSILFVENTSANIAVQVLNSTFANISTNTESYYAGIIDVRNANAMLLVDHCTFYNVIPMNTDYSCVSKITLANGVTSNCIFMLPTAQDNIRAMRGVAATNCITYNYLKDSGTGIHSSVIQTNCVQADPLFVDAANGNFALGEGSPALTMNDGQPIGDPRWFPVIGAPAYFLVGNMNNWTPDSAYMFAVNPANENEYMLNTTLAVGDSVKVLGIVGNTQTWYPDNAPNYGVDANHAGTAKEIYFRPDGQGGNDWYYHVLYIAENPQPVAPTDPYTMTFTYNNKVDGDGSAKLTTAAAIFDAASQEYVAKVDTGIQVYAGRKYKEGNDSIFSNLKLGSSSAIGELRFILAFPMEVDSIVFRAAMYADNEGGEGFKVNGTNYTLSKGKLNFEDMVWTPTGVVDTIDIVQNKASKGRFFLTSITVYPKAAPQPQGCDWDNIEFLGDGSIEQTYANQFKVCVGDPAPTQVVNIQQPGWAAAPGIFMSFPAAPITAAAPLAEDQYAVDGAGVVLYVSAFTAKETEVTITANNVDYVVTVLNVNGTEPQPEVNYSLKNNWDAAADWTWKEMTKDGDNYKLENVVFGGTGVNYQADLPGAPEMWVPMADFLGDKVDAKDTVTFVLNPADSTITVTLIGKYIEPAPEPVYLLWKVDAATDTTHAVKYIDNEYLEVKTVYQGTVVAQNAVIFDETFTHAIQVRADAYPSATDPVGTVKAGSTPLVFTAKLDASFAIYYMRQAVDKAWTDNDNKDIILFDQAAPTVKIAAAKMEADSVLADSSYYFMAKSYNLQAGHTYTLTAKGTTIKLFGISYPAVPEPSHTYTVAGAPATLFGQEWAATYAANDMEPITGSEYLYGWQKIGVALAAGEIKFKICEDHAWAKSWPAQDYVLPISEPGIYNVSILFNPLAEADSMRISAVAQKTGEAVVIPVVVMHGNFTGSWADTEMFTLADDSLTASLKLNLEAKTYDFGMKFDGSWKANGANITRDAASACLATGDGNMHITADVAGEYTFTYTFATQTLAVTYPALPVPAPTTAPAAPTAAEDDVMALYCNHYATNNLNFSVLGWGGVTTWTSDTIDGTVLLYCSDMKWEIMTNWDTTHYDMSAYKKFHADIWAPAAAKVKLTFEALGGAKPSAVFDLVEGWTAIDAELTQWADYDFKDMKYFIFEGYTTPEGESFENNPFAFANVYFYDKKAEGFENIDASAKAVKVLHNGQILILRGDKVYTVTGQPIAK